MNQLSESELKRQLSHDLANDPALATVFNPPQIFSDEQQNQQNLQNNQQNNSALIMNSNLMLQESGISDDLANQNNGTSVVVHWTNPATDLIVSSLI